MQGSPAHHCSSWSSGHRWQALHRNTHHPGTPLQVTEPLQIGLVVMACPRKVARNNARRYSAAVLNGNGIMLLCRGESPSCCCCRSGLGGREQANGKSARVQKKERIEVGYFRYSTNMPTSIGRCVVIRTYWEVPGTTMDIEMRSGGSSRVGQEKAGRYRQ